MTRAVSFRVYGTPAPKGSPQVVTRGRGGKRLPFPLVLADSRATKNWQSAVRQAAVTEMGDQMPLGQPVVVIVTFYMPRPKSVKRTFPSVKPDIDKLLRATLDGLNGVAVADDALVVDLSAGKRYAPGDPGAFIIVQEVAT